VAVKKIEKASLTSSKIKETLIREIRIQKQMNHEYICRLYTSFEDKETIYLALEYASKGNLFYLIRKEKYLSEDTAFYFFIQVCSGIYYMHKQGLIHRDIKPEKSSLKKATSSRFVILDGAYSQTTANRGTHSVERSSIWLQR